MSPPYRALFAVHFDSYFAELFRAARALHETGGFECVFVFALDIQRQAARDAEVCRRAGFRCVDLDGEEFNASAQPVPPAPAAQPSPGLEKIRVRYRRPRWDDPILAVIEACKGAADWYRVLGCRLNRTRRCLARCRPDVVILGDDNPVNDSGVWPAVARELGLPTVVIPYTLADESELVNGILNCPTPQAHRGNRPLNRLVGRAFPQWVNDRCGERLLREPAEKVIAFELRGLSIERPWSFFSGTADAVAVESLVVRRRLVAQGLKPSKLVLIGSAAIDLLAEHARDVNLKRAALLAELGLDPGKPFILWGLTFDHLPRQGCDFRRFRDLLEFFMCHLERQSDFNVVVRPHPRVTDAEVAWIGGNQVRLSSRDTAELIALCAFYVASISASIRWAIACARPVLNYDVYRYGFSDYAEAGGVVTVTERDEFVDVLDRMTGDSGYLASLAVSQQACQSEWGQLDGRSGERLADLVGGLVEHHGHDQRYAN